MDTKSSGSQNDQGKAGPELTTGDEEQNTFPAEWKSSAKLPYSSSPVLIDRDSEGKLHHYYADIVKTDADEESRATFQPLEIAKFLPALFSSGMVDFNYSEFETIDLGGVSKVILAFEATGTRPQRRILRVRE
ncbi:hypothetical protein ACJ41O_003547 [Fusarium nematophilum]